MPETLHRPSSKTHHIYLHLASYHLDSSFKIAAPYLKPKKMRAQTTEMPRRKAFQAVGISNTNPKAKV